MCPEFSAIRHDDSGTLSTKPRPRGGDWLEHETAVLSAASVNMLTDHARRSEEEYCTGRDTLVLRDDLRWVSASSLVEGDSLIAFDEHIGIGHGGGSARLRRAALRHVGPGKLPSLRIVTNRGDITISEDHQFVVRHSDRNRKWKLVTDVREGDHLLWLGKPWGDLGDIRDAGYAAGVIDGEGWLGGRLGSKRVFFGQRPGLVWDEAIACFKRLGFEVRNDVAESGMRRMWIAGGRYESMRFLGQVRPVRLLERSDETWLGGNLVSKGPFVELGACLATVQSVQRLGEVAEVVTMQTNTRTVIANGFFSHTAAELQYLVSGFHLRGRDRHRRPGLMVLGCLLDTDAIACDV